jgi:hypothetical protein
LTASGKNTNLLVITGTLKNKASMIGIQNLQDGGTNTVASWYVIAKSLLVSPLEK